MARQKRPRIFDRELVLIQERVTTDELANQIKEEVRTTVLCDVDSVGSNEFYNASVQGLKPTKTFVVHSFEYQDEDVVEFNGKKYRVVRTYENDYEEVELTCERVLRDG